MNIRELLNSGRVTLSFEVFPPKADVDFEPIREAVGRHIRPASRFYECDLWRERRYFEKYRPHSLLFAEPLRHDRTGPFVLCFLHPTGGGGHAHSAEGKPH